MKTLLPFSSPISTSRANRQTDLHFSALNRNDRLERLNKEILLQLDAGSPRGLESLLKRQTSLIQKHPQILTEGLCRAVGYHQQDSVLHLLKAGALINEPDQAGYTPIHRAAWKGDRDMVLLLHQKGGDVNIPTPDLRVSPLQTASIFGDVEMVKLLLSLGADVHHTSKSGQNAAYGAKCEIKALLASV